MRPKLRSYLFTTADADGVCLSQTPSGAGAMTIAGALASGGVATFDVARHFSITAAGNDSGRTFTVTGTDRYGASISEAITGPNTTTVVSVKNFKTITIVSVDAATAGAITVGSADSAETPWIPTNYRKSPFELTVNTDLTTGASLTYAMEVTNSDVQAPGFQENDALKYTHATITAKTADFVGSQITPVTAVRYLITSYVSGTLRSNISQSG